MYLSTLRCLVSSVDALLSLNLKMDKYLVKRARSNSQDRKLSNKNLTPKRLKTEQHPDSTIIYHSRLKQDEKVDPGFTVSRWGSLRHDVLLGADVVPSGFGVQRTMQFEHFFMTRFEDVACL